MTWLRALDYQMELADFWKSSFGVRYGQGFAESLAQKGSSQYSMLPQIEYSKMKLADPISVSDEIMDMVEAAYLKFKPEPLLPQDSIAPRGFLLLPRPFYMEDRQKRTMAIRAFSWMPSVQHEDGEPTGIFLSAYTHCDDEDDFSEEMAEAYKEKLFGRAHLSLVHVWPWAYGASSPLDQREGDWNKFNEDEISGIASLWSFLQALWRISQQTVANIEREYPGRAQRRAAARMRMPGYITVIKLRRTRHSYEHEGEEAVEWNHRWIVGGHWRNQWYPSLGEHRQVWINMYVKGPEDRPLIVRGNRAFDISR